MKMEPHNAAKQMLIFVCFLCALLASKLITGMVTPWLPYCPAKYGFSCLKENGYARYW